MEEIGAFEHEIKEAQIEGEKNNNKVERQTELRVYVGHSKKLSLALRWPTDRSYSWKVCCFQTQGHRLWTAFRSCPGDY